MDGVKKVSIEIIIAIIGLFITIVINIATIAYFAGVLKSNQDHQKEMIDLLKEEFNKNFKRLEEKQDKHNNLIERMVHVEDSTKSAHHRIDSLEGSTRGNISKRD